MTSDVMPAAGTYRSSSSLEPYRATRLVSMMVNREEGFMLTGYRCTSTRTPATSASASGRVRKWQNRHASVIRITPKTVKTGLSVCNKLHLHSVCLGMVLFDSLLIPERIRTPYTTAVGVRVSDWLSLMHFHPQKCQTMHITNKRNIIQSTYTIHNHKLQTTNTAKYLGIHIHSTLNWNTHINKTAQRANTTSAFLHRNIRTCPRKTKHL